MKYCDKCKWPYPADLLNPLVTTVGTTDSICGICALYLSNGVLGIRRQKFDGPIAESLRQRAKRWRKSNPQLRPDGTKRKGFGSMSPEERAKIASQGGRAAINRHKFSGREAKLAGSKGGTKTAENRRKNAKRNAQSKVPSAGSTE